MYVASFFVLLALCIALCTVLENFHYTYKSFINT